MSARRLEEVLIWMFVSATSIAFRVSVYVYKTNVHFRKAVYLTLQKYKANKQNGTFERDDEGITVYHCEIIKFVMDYNRYLDRIQHNQPKQCSSNSTKQLSKKHARGKRLKKTSPMMKKRLCLASSQRNEQSQSQRQQSSLSWTIVNEQFNQIYC